MAKGGQHPNYILVLLASILTQQHTLTFVVMFVSREGERSASSHVMSREVM